MPFIFKHRDTDLREEMDDPDCDPVALQRTYRFFVHINKLLANWKTLFHVYIAPLCQDASRTYTLLDVGAGGGDVACYLDQLARRQGIQLHITAIDPEPRAHAYMQQLTLPNTITFRCCHLHDLVVAGEQFDFVISNHVLHHLQEDEVAALCSDAGAVATQRVIFNDLVRSEWAWLLFAVGTWGVFRRSFIRADGLRSLRRSFTPAELAALVPETWQVEQLFPFRLVARSA